MKLLEGHIQDIRDLLSWMYDGHRDTALKEQGPYDADVENFAAFRWNSRTGTYNSIPTSFRNVAIDFTLKSSTRLNPGLKRPQACQGCSISLRCRALWQGFDFLEEVVGNGPQ